MLVNPDCVLESSREHLQTLLLLFICVVWGEARALVWVGWMGINEGMNKHLIMYQGEHLSQANVRADHVKIKPEVINVHKFQYHKVPRTWALAPNLGFVPFSS